MPPHDHHDPDRTLTSEELHALFDRVKAEGWRKLVILLPNTFVPAEELLRESPEFADALIATGLLDQTHLHHLGELKELEALWVLGQQVVAKAPEFLAQLTNLIELSLAGCDLGPEGAAHLAGLTKLTNLDLWSCEIGPTGAAHLAGLNKLTDLDLAGCMIGPEGAVHLAGLTNLTNLNLRDCEIGPEGAAHLAGLTNLIDLDLTNCGIGLEGAAHLAGLINLTNLNLANCEIRPQGAAHLAGLTNLTNLDLRNCEIGPEGAAHLAGLTNLIDLDLTNCKIGPEGAAHLAGLINLTNLDLWGCEIGPEGAAHLAGLTNLTNLALWGCEIGPEGAAHLAGLTNLTNLNLWGCEIGPEGAAHLAGLTNLTNLNLWGCEIGPKGAAHLAGLTNLTNLNLWGCKIGPEGAARLAGLINLTNLNLWGCEIGPKGAAHLAGLTNLTNLDLRGCEIDQKGAAHLAGLTNLTNLNLWGCKIGPEGAAHLAGLTNLTNLDLWGCEIGPEGAAHLAGLTNLTNLDLQGCRIGPEGAAHLAVLINLTNLNLWGCEIGPEGAAHLAGLTNLTNLDLRNCEIGPEGAAHLAGLINLTNLDLYGCELELTLDFVDILEGLKDLRRLDLRGNGGLLIRDEGLVSEKPATLIDRLRSLLAHTGRPWREVKIALLGDGEVGKSMIRWRLARISTDPTHPPRAQDRTADYERRQMTFEVPGKDQTRPGPNGTPVRNDVTAHLFDFGGQYFLWGSHRLFLGVQRSLYTIVARADKPLESSGNRVMHWLRMIESMRREIIQARAKAEWRWAWRRDEQDASDESRFVADRVKELEKSLPTPPVLIVITHAKDQRPELQSELKQLKGELGGMAAKGFGTIDVQVVELGERFSQADEQALTIRHAWNDLLVTHRAMPELWDSAKGTTTFFALRDSLEEHMPAITGPGGMLTPWITVERYVEELAAGIGNDADHREKLAMGYLAEFRDVGVVHYVGDAPEGLVRRDSKVRDLIFNPGWAAKPICALLWQARRGQGCTGVMREHEVLACFREHMPTMDRAARSKFPEPEERLLDLMLASKLIFEIEGPAQAERRFIVPDQLPVDPSVTEPPSWALRWSPDFIADAVMPRLIGALWSHCDGGQQHRNRVSLRFGPPGQEARAEMRQAGGRLWLTDLRGASHANREEILRLVRRAVEDDEGVRPSIAEEGPEFIAHRMTGVNELKRSTKRESGAWATRVREALPIVWPKIDTRTGSALSQQVVIELLSKTADALEECEPQVRSLGMIVCLYHFAKSRSAKTPTFGSDGLKAKALTQIYAEVRPWATDRQLADHEREAWNAIVGKVYEKSKTGDVLRTQWNKAHEVIYPVLG